MKLSNLVTTLFAASFLLQVGVLHAKEFKLPNGDFPMASVDIPKDWKPDAIDNGVEAQSEDDTFYLAIVAVGTNKSLQEDNGKALVFTYWFNTPAGDKYENEIDVIQSSLKAAS